MPRSLGSILVIDKENVVGLQRICLVLLLGQLLGVFLRRKVPFGPLLQKLVLFRRKLPDLEPEHPHKGPVLVVLHS